MNCIHCQNTLQPIDGSFFCENCQIGYIKGSNLKDIALRLKIEGVISNNNKCQNCPFCELQGKIIEMEQNQFAYDSGIFIEKCTECGMVHVSFEELLQIQNYFNTLHDYDGQIAALSFDMMKEVKETNEFEKQSKKKKGFFAKMFS